MFLDPWPLHDAASWARGLEKSRAWRRRRLDDQVRGGGELELWYLTAHQAVVIVVRRQVSSDALVTLKAYFEELQGRRTKLWYGCEREGVIGPCRSEEWPPTTEAWPAIGLRYA